MWSSITHYQSNRLNKSARPKIPINTISLLKPFVIDEIIASPVINKPIKLQGFNALNFFNHIIFEFSNNLTKQIGSQLLLRIQYFKQKSSDFLFKYFAGNEN